MQSSENSGGGLSVNRQKTLVAVGHHAEHELGVAAEFGVGVEIQFFARPLWEPGDLSSVRSKVEAMRERISGLAGPIGCHGPYIDTIHYSPDPAVMEVSRKRYLDAIDIAGLLGAKFVVFHSQYNVMIKIPEYPDIYHDQSVLFWPELIGHAEDSGIRIYLENMFDATPTPLRRLVDEFDSESLKLCLDLAHCGLHSELDLCEWAKGYGNHLRHVHLSDCNGVYDDHIGLGEGQVDIGSFMSAMEDMEVSPTFTLETGKKSRESLRYLGLEPVDVADK